MNQKTLIAVKIFLALAIVALTGMVALIGLHMTAQASPDPSRTVHKAVFNLAPKTLSLSGSQTITPSADGVSMYLLAPTSTLTVTLSITGALPGDTVLLVGKVSTSTILADTGATGTGASRTITDTDTWAGVFNGSAWVETNFVNNQ